MASNNTCCDPSSFGFWQGRIEQVYDTAIEERKVDSPTFQTGRRRTGRESFSTLFLNGLQAIPEAALYRAASFLLPGFRLCKTEDSSFAKNIYPFPFSGVGYLFFLSLALFLWWHCSHVLFFASVISRDEYFTIWPYFAKIFTMFQSDVWTVILPSIIRIPFTTHFLWIQGLSAGAIDPDR